jgi:hypothetical protein
MGQAWPIYMGRAHPSWPESAEMGEAKISLKKGIGPMFA